MDKTLNQIPFEFSADEVNAEKQLLSRKVAEPLKEKGKSNRGRKSIKKLDSDQENVEIPEDDILFSKQYYSIGEVANMFKVNTSLLRYWETEFDILEPRKNRKGDRFFKPSDIKNLQLIYDLLRRRKFTIEGAKDYLRKNLRADEKYSIIQSLQRLRAFLLELKANL